MHYHQYYTLKQNVLFGDLDSIKEAKNKKMDLHFEDDVLVKIAICTGDLYILCYLLDLGFVLDVKALYIAIESQNIDVIKFVLSNSKLKLSREMLSITHNKTVNSFLKEKMENDSARIIQSGLENWLWKPICKDGTMCIALRIGLKFIKEQIHSL